MICPKCGKEVYAVDTLNTEWWDNGYYDTVEGHCNGCNTDWQWDEVYTYSRAENIHEIDPNDHL